MTSYLAWLDHSDEQRRKMLDIIDLFREQETRDELGLGGVRDAFGEQLFPGTSTVQTRARYFLFVPWMYSGIEASRVPSAEVGAKARREEVALIEGLIAGGEKLGVIGSEARQSLKRLPSSVYWQGLGSWGIRRFRGQQDQYHRSLDRYYRTAVVAAKNDDGEPVDGSPRNNWDRALPAVPAGFPKRATFALSQAEARYLAGRIETTHSESLLAFLLDQRRVWESCAYPWEHPAIGELNPELRGQLEHARLFSLSLHGAALLYNLLLAEKAAHEEWTEAYRSAIGEWVGEMEEAEGALRRWDRAEFWQLVRRANPAVTSRTQFFVNGWLEIVLPPARARDARESAKSRALIRAREQALKGEQARLQNQRALERWSGAAGTGRMTYRWWRAERIALDILEGLGGGRKDA